MARRPATAAPARNVVPVTLFEGDSYNRPVTAPPKQTEFLRRNGGALAYAGPQSPHPTLTYPALTAMANTTAAAVNTSSLGLHSTIVRNVFPTRHTAAVGAVLYPAAGGSQYLPQQAPGRQAVHVRDNRDVLQATKVWRISLLATVVSQQ